MPEDKDQQHKVTILWGFEFRALAEVDGVCNHPLEEVVTKSGARVETKLVITLPRGLY